MHTYAKGILLLSLTAATFGCKSFEKMKGILTKSEDKPIATTTYEGQGYTNPSEGRNEVWVNRDSTEVITDLASTTNPMSRTQMLMDSTQGAEKSYARNYDVKAGVAPAASTVLQEGSLQAYNQKMVDQYKEMDQLGEVVLYEINMIDKTWSQYAQQYKMASANERDQLSRELSRLDDNKLLLYKAYTRIYKQGKVEWVAVKKEVENTLLSVRGLK